MKLDLDWEDSVKYIVGMAIRDGVIEGRIMHEKVWMGRFVWSCTSRA